MIDPGTQENGEDYLAYNRGGGAATAGRIRCEPRGLGRALARRLENLAEHVKGAPAPALRAARDPSATEESLFEAIYENGERVGSGNNMPLRLENGVDVAASERS